MATIELKNTKRKASPGSAKEKKTSEGFDIAEFLSRDIKLFGSGWEDKKKERFYSELSLLLGSGLDLKTSMELISAEQKKQDDIKVYESLKKNIIAGKNLADSMQETKKFTDYEFYTIQIGEETGRLLEVLNELSQFYTKQIKQKRQVVSTLTYPCIILSVAFGLMFLMLKYFVPMFSEIFKRFDTEIPAFTKKVIALSDFVSNYSFYMLLGIFGTMIFIYSQRKKMWFRKYGSAIALRLPVFKTMVEKIYISRFCHAMGLMIAARTNLNEALELVKKMIGFYPIEITIDPIIKNVVNKGMSLHESLKEHKIYNPRMVSLIKVAEEVNQLDSMFSRLAKQYDEEIEYQSKILNSLIEPFIIIFLGVIVAGIFIAIYMPLLQLGTAIH